MSKDNPSLKDLIPMALLSIGLVAALALALRKAGESGILYDGSKLY